jgi:hypothetical protein
LLVRVQPGEQVFTQVKASIGTTLIAPADEVDQMGGADLFPYSSQELERTRQELIARSSAIVDELVRRFGVDETCRQLGVVSIDELYRLPDQPAAD